MKNIINLVANALDAEAEAIQAIKEWHKAVCEEIEDREDLEHLNSNVFDTSYILECCTTADVSFLYYGDSVKVYVEDEDMEGWVSTMEFWIKQKWMNMSVKEIVDDIEQMNKEYMEEQKEQERESVRKEAIRLGLMDE